MVKKIGKKHKEDFQFNPWEGKEEMLKDLLSLEATITDPNSIQIGRHNSALTESIWKKYVQAQIGDYQEVDIYAHFGVVQINPRRMRHYMIDRWRGQKHLMLDIRDEYWCKMTSKWRWAKAHINIPLGDLEHIIASGIVKKALPYLAAERLIRSKEANDLKDLATTSTDQEDG